VIAGYTVLVVLSFLLFGIRVETLIFAAVAAIVFALSHFRTRSQLLLPLRDLTVQFRRAATGGTIPAIVRGSREVRDIAAAVGEWSATTQNRIRDLSEARTRLESILSSMVEGVLVFDSKGRITLTNNALHGLLEQQGDPLGKTCLEVFRNEVFDNDMRNVLNGNGPRAVEFQTSSERLVRVLLSPVLADDGTCEAAVAVLHDLTEIRQVDRVRRDFVANVSHEFKTPLTSIRGYAETMREEAASDSSREFADVIYRNALYLEALVNDLLALARIESEPPSSIDVLELGSLLADQVVIRGRLPEAATMTIEVSCPSIELQADRSRLSTALGNLIDNAIRYNRPDGTVRIEARVEGPHVVISVSDSGFGIRDEELPRIFERFYRVDKSRTRDSGGTGLGLAIARHAVESQGGVLAVTSKVGAGTTFTIRLPAGPRK
jgi:two-component system phosphate regulon sensor histidine kinase PhoR